MPSKDSRYVMCMTVLCKPYGEGVQAECCQVISVKSTLTECIWSPLCVRVEITRDQHLPDCSSSVSVCALFTGGFILAARASVDFGPRRLFPVVFREQMFRRAGSAGRVSRSAREGSVPAQLRSSPALRRSRRSGVPAADPPDSAGYGESESPLCTALRYRTSISICKRVSAYP